MKGYDDSLALFVRDRFPCTILIEKCYACRSLIDDTRAEVAKTYVSKSRVEKALKKQHPNSPTGRLLRRLLED